MVLKFPTTTTYNIAILSNPNTTNIPFLGFYIKIIFHNPSTHQHDKFIASNLSAISAPNFDQN